MFFIARDWRRYHCGREAWKKRGRL